MPMRDRTIIQGETTSWASTFSDADGRIDFTSATRTATLRMLHRSTGVTTTKTTSDSDDWTWTSQSNGAGIWTLTSTEADALTRGEYICDVVFKDTATTPETVHIVGGPVTYNVRAARAGAL